MRVRFLLAAVIAAMVACGCGPRVLMKTPAVVAVGDVDPFAQVVPERRTNAAPVFVATSRTVSGDPEPAKFYTNDRDREVRLGLAKVQIGAGMDWDQLARASRAEKRDEKPTVVLTSYDEYGPLWTTFWPPSFHFARDWDAPGVDRGPASEFAADIDEMLAASRRRQITIFVHGFNTKFADNVELSGEFWHYLSRDGVMICFDWPSRGNMFTYQVDKANAEFAVRQFRRLLEFLGQNTTAARINIIAHSAGNPIVVEALQQLSLMHYAEDAEILRQRLKIGRVVFAAPDMDLDRALTAGVDGMGRLTQGIAVYASRRDKALGLSGSIFGDVRVGRSIGKLSDDEVQALIANKGQWIDVTNAERWSGSFLGHSYFHQDPWISSDILLFLIAGVTPEDRGLVRDMKTGFLTFPDDYRELLPEIGRHLRDHYHSPEMVAP